MDISIVIPLYNEEESLRELIREIEGELSQTNYSYEVIFVDDGSTDSSWEVIQELVSQNNNCRGIQFQCNQGKSIALDMGFREVTGTVVITMDADLQDNPSEILPLYKMIMEDGFDMVSGWKKVRKDPLSKTLPSKLYNYTARRISGIRLHDFNCGLKAYHVNVIRNIELYGEMHRYIPLLARKAGFKKIGEKVVHHRRRQFGVSKFGTGRFLKGFLDLTSLTFILRFGERPMHFFGTIGTLMFFLGFCSSLYLGIDKLIALQKGVHQTLITNNPFFYLALLCMILGTQLFLAGFLAELVSRFSQKRTPPIIKEYLNFKKNA